MYENQVASIKHKSRTATMVLAANAHYNTPADLPDEKRGNTGCLEWTNLSRYAVAMIRQENGVTTTTTGNIPASDVYYIKRMTDMAFEKMNAPKKEDPKNPVFTQRFAFGTYKGKTALEAAVAGASEADLIKIQDLLKKNAEKFPANKTMIKEIDLAIELLRMGELESVADSVKANDASTLYNSEIKFLESKKDEEGRVFVYSIVLKYNEGYDYPFEVRIENGYAPITRFESGQVNVHMKETVNKKSLSMALSAKEFVSFVDKLFFTLRDYEASAFPAAYEKAKQKTLEILKKKES